MYPIPILSPFLFVNTTFKNSRIFNFLAGGYLVFGHKDLIHALVGCAFCRLEAIEIKASNNTTFDVAATATEYC